LLMNLSSSQFWMYTTRDLEKGTLDTSDVGDEREGVEQISEGVQGEAEMIDESSKTGVLGSRGVRGI
jgi:hypothetical protein